ncbi:hypothetical protein MKW98_032350 [Papaver atlanticum]|uniref:Uncharacterized protein n=1 Tax=Papaver atlanticum TaxID=357466 RepID=A0AAD4SEX2_9MAGN|nr:hypothetical protein MKW98_032350 [Papaver atlanticum]
MSIRGEHNVVVVDQLTSPIRREFGNRSMKTLISEAVDLEAGTDVNDQNRALMSGLAYCISSCSMILINKFVLSRYDFNAGISLVLYQNLVSVVIVSAEFFWSDLHRATYLEIDTYFHAIAVGYTWQILNCFLTASYSLTLRRVMDTANEVTKSGNLNEFKMWTGRPLLRTPTFWVVMTSSRFIGFAIRFTSMWSLHQTWVTTYSLVGSLNKIPLSVAGNPSVQ